MSLGPKYTAYAPFHRNLRNLCGLKLAKTLGKILSKIVHWDFWRIIHISYMYTYFQAEKWLKYLIVNRKIAL